MPTLWNPRPLMRSGRISIAVDHRHLVVKPGQHARGTEPRHASADHNRMSTSHLDFYPSPRSRRLWAPLGGRNFFPFWNICQRSVDGRNQKQGAMEFIYALATVQVEARRAQRRLVSEWSGNCQ